jgi:hypothetical protein
LAGKEEAGDAEMVHRVAPGARIQVILMPQPTGADQAAQATAGFARALPLAPSLGQVVVITFGLGESCYTPAEVAEWNTALQASRITGAYQGETAWNTPPPAGTPIPAGFEPPEASNGGFCSFFARPGGFKGFRRAMSAPACTWPGLAAPAAVAAGTVHSTAPWYYIFGPVAVAAVGFVLRRSRRGGGGPRGQGPFGGS